jgi:hypothetical protein
MTENTFKEEPSLVRVLPSSPGHGSTHRSPEFCQVVAPTAFLTNPNRSSHQVDRVPGRAGFNNYVKTSLKIHLS